nr:putative integron gene cassette protein [uncultured bacterium]
MIEGWNDDQYLILFDEIESGEASERYRIDDALPGFTIVGLLGWDDLIVRNEQGRTFTVPTVPINTAELQPYEIPKDPLLTLDSDAAGRIKWYIKPVVFGGDPGIGDNLTWVSHEQHAELVIWWNLKYRETKTQKTNG